MYCIYHHQILFHLFVSVQDLFFLSSLLLSLLSIDAEDEEEDEEFSMRRG